VKESGIIAGLPIAARVFQLLNPQVEFVPQVKEGQWCDRGEAIAEIQGSLAALLTGERVALNLAMRLSGIATLTNKYVEQIADLPTCLVDTRKTTPGLRVLEKYATQVGGAVNHRMGLDDGVMIKDNHIAAAGGIAEAIAKIRAVIPYPLTIEVETETLDQVAEAVAHRADIIMLDNFSIDDVREASRRARANPRRPLLEVSGGITLERIGILAAAGIDVISVGALTHSAPNADIALDLKI